MVIPERVKRFINNTNSFCVIMEDDQPAYILSSFDWAERMMLPPEMGELDEVEEVNNNISLVAEETREGVNSQEGVV